MGINHLDYKDNFWHVLKHKKKYISFAGNKRSLTMTNVKHGSYNKCLHIQIFLGF